MKRASPATLTILDAIQDSHLFGPWFSPSEPWRAWLVFLAALFGLPLSETDQIIYQQHTGRSQTPATPAREAWLVVGRRGGKSRIAALVAVWLACFRDARGLLAPGERGVVMVLAADRRQAGNVLGYITGFLDAIPMLGRLIERRTADAIFLTNRIVIEVHTASYRTVRGYTVVAAILDEVAFWRSEESANPDVEVVNAIRPAMATVREPLLLGLSSPYARRGVLWDAFNRHYGKEGDPILVWRGTTREMNPLVDPRVIRDAYEQDEVAADAEYGANFRRDIEAFVSLEAVQRVVVPGQLELPWAVGVRYVAFVDFSGGGPDSMTLAIAHRDSRKVVLDLVREARPPFSPEDVTKEFCAILKAYSLSHVTGDQYGGLWPRERFWEHGVAYEIANRTKSDLYRALLPMINSGRVELLDHPRSLRQLITLERSVSKAGRELISHPPGGHDDLVNAVAGAVVSAQAPRLFECYKEPQPRAQEPFYWTHEPCGTQRLVDPAVEREPYRCLHCNPGWRWGPGGPMNAPGLTF